MRLQKRKQFQRMAKSPFRWTGEWILVTIRPVHQHPCKLGIVVTKKFGCSPKRNRFKRLVRESFRLSFPFFTSSFEILVRPRSKAVYASMQQIQAEMTAFIMQFQTLQLTNNESVSQNPAE